MSSENTEAKKDKTRLTDHLASNALDGFQIVLLLLASVWTTVFSKTGTNFAIRMIELSEFIAVRAMDAVFGAGTISAPVWEGFTEWVRTAGRPALTTCLQLIGAIVIATSVLWVIAITFVMSWWNKGEINAAAILLVVIGLSSFFPAHGIQLVMRHFFRIFGKEFTNTAGIPEEFQGRRLVLEPAVSFTRMISVTTAIHFFMASMLISFPGSMMRVNLVTGIVATLLLLVTNSQSIGRQRQRLMTLMFVTSFGLTVWTVSWHVAPHSYTEARNAWLAEISTGLGYDAITMRNEQVVKVTLQEDVHGWTLEQIEQYENDSQLDINQLGLVLWCVGSEGIALESEVKMIEGYAVPHVPVVFEEQGELPVTVYVPSDKLTFDRPDIVAEPKEKSGSQVAQSDPRGRNNGSGVTNQALNWSGMVGKAWEDTKFILKGDLVHQVFDQVVWTSLSTPLTHDQFESMEYAFALPEVGPEYAEGDEWNHPDANGPEYRVYALCHINDDNNLGAHMYIRFFEAEEPVRLQLVLRPGGYRGRS